MFQYLCWQWWVRDLHGQPKFMSTEKENAGVEEVECKWSGDSRVMWLPSKASVGSLRRVSSDIEYCRSRRPMFSIWLYVLLCLDLERITFFIVLPSSNRINFSLSYFLPRTSSIGRKISFNLKRKNSINISPCSELMRRDAFFFFFSFWKKSRPRHHSVRALLFCWLELPFVCTINQKRSVSVI